MFKCPSNLYLRRLSVAVLVVTATLLTLEAIARMGFFLAKPELSHSTQFDQKLWIAEHPQEEEKTNDTLVLLGNSQIKYALYPEQMELTLGQNVLNLGSDAATPQMNLFLLKQALDSGYKVSGVVYNINPLSFSKTHTQHPELTAQKTFNQSFIGQCQIKDPEHFAALVDCRLQQFSVLYRYRSWLNRKRDDLGRAVLKPSLIYQSRRYNVTATEFSPDGWAVGYRTYTPEAFKALFSLPTPLEEDVKPILENFNYTWDTTGIDQLKAFCEARSLHLTLVWLPRNPLWFKAHAFFNLDEVKEQAILEQIKTYTLQNNMGLIDLHTMPLSDTQYYDTNHQNVLGSLAVTPEFTTQYQRLLKKQEATR